MKRFQSIAAVALAAAYLTGPTSAAAEPTMYVIDHTTPAWTAAVAHGIYAWDASPDVAVQPARHCPPQQYCVRVVSGTYNNVSWTGGMDFRNHTILLNDRDLNRYWSAEHTVTHELGHALGITWHEETGLMAEGYGQPDTPGPGDFAILRAFADGTAVALDGPLAPSRR